LQAVGDATGDVAVLGPGAHGWAVSE
jgi:hypothetical protein